MLTFQQSVNLREEEFLKGEKNAIKCHVKHTDQPVLIT